MAHDLFDAMLGFFGGSEVGKVYPFEVTNANGSIKKHSTLRDAQKWLASHPGSRITKPAQRLQQQWLQQQWLQAQRLQAQRLQQGQQPMLQAQPYGQPGATLLPGQPGYPYQPGQPGYGSPVPQGPVNYGPGGPVNYGPGGYQGPASYSGPDQGAGPYPTDYLDAPDAPDDDFPDDANGALGVAAAVGEAAVGTEQYAQVGGVDITRWLVDPWDAATADAAHRLMVLATGLSGASTFERVAAQRTIAELKKQSNKGNPLAQRAMINFGSITKMVQRGRPVPSVAVLAMPAPGTVVARPVGALARQQMQTAAQRQAAKDRQILDRHLLAEKTRAAFNATKADYEAQLRDLNKQLERRDWSDETRKQLEDQAAEYEKKLAAMAPGAAPAPAEPEPGELEADDAPLSEGVDFDADVAGADGA